MEIQCNLTTPKIENKQQLCLFSSQSNVKIFNIQSQILTKSMPFLQVGFYCSSSCPSPRAIGNRTGTSASQARLWNNSLGLQSPACEDAYSHWLPFPQCVFSIVSSNRLSERMHSHIGCICLALLHCVFSNVSSNRLHKTMHSHIAM